jgi:hypothetical protein
MDTPTSHAPRSHTPSHGSGDYDGSPYDDIRDQGNVYVHADHAGSSGVARRVMDFFRRNLMDRENWQNSSKRHSGRSGLTRDVTRSITQPSNNHLVSSPSETRYLGPTRGFQSRVLPLY